VLSNCGTNNLPTIIYIVTWGIQRADNGCRCETVGYIKHVLALPFPRQNSLAVDVSLCLITACQCDLLPTDIRG